MKSFISKYKASNIRAGELMKLKEQFTLAHSE
jgi:hypothetical protein